AQILYLGAEFAHVYARRREHALKPATDTNVGVPPLRPRYVVAALAAVGGFLLGRTPLRRVAAGAPEAAKTAAEVALTVDGSEGRWFAWITRPIPAALCSVSASISNRRADSPSVGADASRITRRALPARSHGRTLRLRGGLHGRRRPPTSPARRRHRGAGGGD